MKRGIRISISQVVFIAIAIGLIARVISPQFTEASTETKVCGLVKGLDMMRAQLDLYRVVNGNSLPPTNSFEDFENSITAKTAQYDPFVKAIPVNPFNNLSNVRFDGEPAGSGKAGWRLDTHSGLFQADNDAAYSAL